TPAATLLVVGSDPPHGWPPPLERLDPPVDVPELGVPVGMILSLDRLAVGLEAVAEGVQEPVDRPLASGVPARRQLRRQLVGALAGPPQGRHRVTTGDRVDQGLQRTEELRVVLGEWLATAPRPPAPRGAIALVAGSGPGLGRARPDGDASQSGGLGDPGYAAPSDGTSLSGRPESACPLIEHRPECGVLLGDDFN